ARYRWRRRAGDVHRHPAVRARAAALPLPQTFPVRIQRRDLQPAPLAEYPPAQPARRKLPRQLLGLTRRMPPSCTRLLFAHPSTQTSPPQIGKMGWSDGYAPMTARSSVSLATITKTDLGVAPTAMRIPISFVLRATAYDVTPKVPIAASTIARPANTLTSSVFRRRAARVRQTNCSIVDTSATG